ncbi:MAG TPA: DUF5715 family protein [Pyrinomonadaceae bacterium]|nr:DUF5715 family protein [Pyrinomonadaceae bacterium]
MAGESEQRPQTLELEDGSEAHSPAGSASGEGNQAAGAASKPGSARRAKVWLLVIVCCALAGLVWVFFNSKYSRRLAEQAERVRTAIVGAPVRPTPDPYVQALARVEENRGEAMGRAASVEIPAELKLYRESRRFLALQAAAAEEAELKSPHDFAELAEIVREGQQLVELPKLGREYVLYGVGQAAGGELTHYDARSGRSVLLLADEEELKAYRDELAADRARLEDELREVVERLKGIDKSDKTAREQLSAEESAKRKELDGVKNRIKSIDSFYDPPETRRMLFDEYAFLTEFARNFGGRAYDLRQQASAREFQARLLSYLRPAALSVVEELGARYREKFERPLPITSLVRTEEYQRRLREGGNPNAADVSVPPHTTGLAFDVFYRFMTQAEQEFLMNEIARLEEEGRVEALRELRDHYHVFVFPEGRRPAEKLVREKMRSAGRTK